MDPKIKAIRREKWFRIIIAANSSGMPKKEWCKEHNVSTKTFYHWQKVIRSEEADRFQQALQIAADAPQQLPSQRTASDFAVVYEQSGSDMTRSEEFSAPQSHLQPEMMLQAGEYQLFIGSGVREATLQTVLRVIAHA